MSAKSPAPDVVVTSALPYANGPIHIGHLVEYVQTDVYARYLKLSGENAVYCCAGDTHGTPIEINARQQGVTPEELVAKYLAAHQADFARYHIAFDSYYSTNSDENKTLAELIYKRLQEAGLIEEKTLELSYCESCKRFLPDRYVKGTCPKCGASDQYGDVCESCHATYTTVELVNPYCTLCKNTPVRKESDHYFFKLSKSSDFLKEWLEGHAHLQSEIKKQVLQWVNEGLKDWCISRDAPYFGFKIPGTEKYFYVWLDAPIGYISSLAHLLGDDVEAALEVWNKARVEHFIGKDIMYFHLLFWPAVLHAAGLKVPENIIVHGFLTVDGEKMSKSRGTFLTAAEFADTIADTEFLRFYYAANLSHAMTDVDLNLDDFTNRVNKELVGNVANFVYRTLSFTKKNYDGRLAVKADDKAAKDVEAFVKEKSNAVLAHYKAYEFRKAVQGILQIADAGNVYFQRAEPWKKKEESNPALTVCANIVKEVAILLAPITPGYSAEVAGQLGLQEQGLTFDDLGFTLEDCTLGEPRIVWRPIEKPSIGVGKKAEKKGEQKKGTGKKEAKTLSPAILDLRAAKITKVERHPNAEKLYVETLDDGSGEERVIVSGLVPYYNAEELEGKTIVLVNNLKAAKLRGVKSEGMLLAADDGQGTIEVLTLEGVKAGTPIKIKGFEQGTEEITIDDFFKLKFTVNKNQAFCEGVPLLANEEAVKTTKVEKGKVA